MAKKFRGPLFSAAPCILCKQKNTTAGMNGFHVLQGLESHQEKKLFLNLQLPNLSSQTFCFLYSS